MGGDLATWPPFTDLLRGRTRNGCCDRKPMLVNESTGYIPPGLLRSQVPKPGHGQKIKNKWGTCTDADSSDIP